MTPDQLERIKQELTNYLFDRGHRISKPLIEDIVSYITTETIDKKLERMKKKYKCNHYFNYSSPDNIVRCVCCKSKYNYKEHPPIQLKNLNNPE